MANITRFDPFAEITSFKPFADVESLFKNFRLRPFDMDAEPRIKVDVEENDQAYSVKAEMPGVNKDDIKVSVDGNQVSIEAEVKREEEEKKDQKVVRSERYYGKQYRSFGLASDIDASKAEAEYKDGVLLLTLPKKANGSAKELKVK